jgi:hypothetical protein
MQQWPEYSFQRAKVLQCINEYHGLILKMDSS